MTFDEIEDWKKDYLRGLQEAIGRSQFYPEEARRRRETGTVKVGFVLLRDGRIARIHLRRSSGSLLLDEAAQEALRRLGRYKPIPPAFGRSRWEMAVPIRYDLR
jgi:protein TonB